MLEKMELGLLTFLQCSRCATWTISSRTWVIQDFAKIACPTLGHSIHSFFKCPTFIYLFVYLFILVALVYPFSTRNVLVHMDRVLVCNFMQTMRSLFFFLRCALKKKWVWGIGFGADLRTENIFNPSGVAALHSVGISKHTLMQSWALQMVVFKLRPGLTKMYWPRPCWVSSGQAGSVHIPGTIWQVS